MFLKNERIRLDKFLSSQLNISRSDAKRLLKRNAVTINGVCEKSGDVSITATEDIVCVNGKQIVYNKFIYIMLNKPKGIVSASSDNKDTTVIDILPEELKRSGLFPAGRLDKDTTGFVLITDDGEFAHNILSPSHHVPKTYLVEVAHPLDDCQLMRFRDGMLIGEELFKPAQLRPLNKLDNNNFLYEITIIEGRYHQIKRMFASAGAPVLELKRISIGGLPLDPSLAEGASRLITREELLSIINTV